MCIQCHHKGCCGLGNFPDSTRLVVCGGGVVLYNCLFSDTFGGCWEILWLCIVGGVLLERCCGAPCSLFDTFMCYWEVLWSTMFTLRHVYVLLGGIVAMWCGWGGCIVWRELGGGVMCEEHKRVPMTDSPKTIATTVPTYVSIIAHIRYNFQVK